MKNSTYKFWGVIILMCLTISLGLVLPSSPKNIQTDHYLRRNMKIGEVLEIKINVGESFRYDEHQAYVVRYRGMINDDTFVVGTWGTHPRDWNYIKVGTKLFLRGGSITSYEYELLSGNEEHIIIKITYLRSQV